MFRIILVILLALVAIRLFKNLRRSFQQRSQQRPTTNANGSSPQEMVSCHRCGTFIVKSSALYNGSNYYCSEGCRLGH